MNKFKDLTDNQLLRKFHDAMSATPPNLMGNYPGTDEAYDELVRRGVFKHIPWYACFPGSAVWIFAPVVLLILIK